MLGAAPQGAPAATGSRGGCAAPPAIAHHPTGATTQSRGHHQCHDHDQSELQQQPQQQQQQQQRARHAGGELLRAPPQRYASPSPPPLPPRSPGSAGLACQARVAKAGAVPGAWPAANGGCVYHHHHHHHGGAGACACRLPRTAVLCQLLAATIALLVFVQAVSCGMFFCVTLPFAAGHASRPYVDYRDLISDIDATTPSSAAAASAAAAGAGGAGGPGGAAAAAAAAAAPKLIPRVIHQTHASARLPAPARPLMRSWQQHNGGWQVRFYSDGAALDFVRREFPEYFEAYLSLPKDVERADFFRYMVVLRLGGVYADIDAECRQPLDGVIQPADTLLVGWDDEPPHADGGGGAAAAAAAEASQPRQRRRQFARSQQVASWFFAAAPGHPVLRELCDHIARSALRVFSNDTVRDTMERTGQGVWTDRVLQHALQHPAAKHDDPWHVRVLPRVALGVRPSEVGELGPHLPGVVVLHHFLGTWQRQRGWGRGAPAHRKALQVVAPVLRPWLRRADADSGAAELDGAEPPARLNATRLPVSVAFNPPFTVMVDAPGSGDARAAAEGDGVGPAIAAHGTWQPAVAPYRRPAVVDALVGALSRRGEGRGAAAAGRAAEAAAAAAAAAADAAAADAAAAPAADAAPAPRAQGVLVDVGAGLGFFSLAAAARGHRAVAFEASPGSLAALRASAAYNGFQQLVEVHGDTALGAQGGEVCLERLDEAAAGAGAEPAGVLLRRRRGYAHLGDAAAAAACDAGCARCGRRRRLTDVLPAEATVAALRVSAHGHEGWVVEGALELLSDPSRRPEVVYLEFCPAAMRAAGYERPRQLLALLYGLGYSDAAHAGRLCDRRWRNATAARRSQGSFAPSVLQQPTWCKLRPDNFQLLVDLADSEVPENVLFVLARQQQQAAADAGGAGAGGSASSSAQAGGSDGDTSSEAAADGSRSVAARAHKQDQQQQDQQRSAARTSQGTVPSAALPAAAAGAGEGGGVGGPGQQHLPPRPASAADGEGGTRRGTAAAAPAAGAGHSREGG